MIDFLSKNRPRRTAAINIDNGEEDGLHGAPYYALSVLPNFYMLPEQTLWHSWSNLTSMFLNFEGAGSGGYVPPQLPVIHPNFNSRRSQSTFPLPTKPRTTSSNISALHRIYTPTSFLKTLGTEASPARIRITPSTLPLAPGMFPAFQTIATHIKALGGMQGADIAFYRSRSRYHTMDNSMRGTGDEGEMRSLWALLEFLRFVGDNTLNTKTGGSSSDESERAV
jgi:hypothetical protein